MADGGRVVECAQRLGEARLAAAGAARSSLWARCGCGRKAEIDPGPWMAQGLGRQAVETLEDRLRCLCGARRVSLEIRDLAEAPSYGADSGGAGGIYVFR